MRRIIILASVSTMLSACIQKIDEVQEQLSQEVIRAHIDTSIHVFEPYAVVKLPLENGTPVWNPGILETGPEGRIFSANMTGEIYSLCDTDDDGLEDTALQFCDVTQDGFRTPTGMVFKGWDLYVGLPQEIRIYRDLDHDFIADTSFTFFDQIPYSNHPYEYTTGLRFDDQGWMYFALSTDSWNAGASPDPKKYRGAILKVSPDGLDVKVVVTGIRSAYGMDFNAQGDLYFADNQGGQNAVEELNLLQDGKFYGHNTKKYFGLKETEPVANLLSEVAPAEIQFKTLNGKEYLYVAFYGPGEYWQRGAVVRIEFSKNPDDDIEIVEQILAEIPKSGGLTVANNDNIYVSSVGETDYWYFAKESRDGSIYRLIPAPWIIPSRPVEEKQRNFALDSDIIDQGKFLFARLACSSCHSIDGKSELLGPDLKNIGSVYSREELLEEIREPSKRMKPGTFPTRITTNEGEVFLGRVITQDEHEVQLMLIGNLIKSIPTARIQETESLTESLMYEDLLYGLTDQEVDTLLDYLISLGGSKANI